MANQGNQQLRILYIKEIFEEYTDVDHPITAAQIIERLEERDVVAERKSIYRAIAALQEYGMDIEKCADQRGFYLSSRTFELPELKLLVDAVAASKFITENKARGLLAKLEGLCSVHEGRHLRRQVVVSDRVKQNDGHIYYTIDEIYQCIDANHRMQFQYLSWGADKNQVLRHDGMIYEVSPAFLLWNDAYYYLVAYDEKAGGVRHFRVDRMVSAKETDLPRSSAALALEEQKGDYTKRRFSMFSGEATKVTLLAPASLAGVMIDRFGKEVTMRREDDKILVRTEVEVSPQFFGWLTGLGSGVSIHAPEEARTAYQSYLKQILDGYKESSLQ